MTKPTPTLYDLAQAAYAAGVPVADAMEQAGAHKADRSWPVVRAVEAARFEFALTRTWPVVVWLRNGPGETDPLDAIAQIGVVAFDLQETPESRLMTDDELLAYTRAQVRNQIRAAIATAGKKKRGIMLAR